MKSRRLRSGFTLIELSVVLIIIAVITGMSVTSGLGALAEAKRVQTQKKLDTIEAALLSYRLDNRRLPCPGDATLASSNASYGKAAPDMGNCTSDSTIKANFGAAGNVVEGAVPVATLNLTNDFMYDGWGRKFAYAVDTNATEYNAFNTINIGDACGITIESADADSVAPVPNPRTTGTGAIYALISFGPDGHGGYLAGSNNRMSSGATNTDELTNCHCTKDSPPLPSAYNATYVQKENTGDPSAITAANYFDDIVRYKMRWQLLSSDDQYSLAYNGPQVLAGFNNNDTASYKLQCGRLKQQNDLSGIQGATGVVFLPSLLNNVANAYALVFYNSGPSCKVYPIASNGTLGSAIAGNLGLTCPGNSGVRAAASVNGYLAFTQNSSPYIQVWQQSGVNDNFQQLTFMTPASVPNPTPIAYQPTSISISDNYLVVSNNNTLNGFLLNGNSVTPVPLPAAGSTGGPPTATTYYASAVSANGYYMALLTLNGSGKPVIYLWNMNEGIPASIGSTTMTNSDATLSAPAGFAFSPDAKYLAIGGDGVNNDVIIASIDTVGNTINNTTGIIPTGLAALPNAYNGTNFAFSPDATYLTMTTPSTAANPPSLVMLRQTSSNTYKLGPLPDISPAAASTAVIFNH